MPTQFKITDDSGFLAIIDPDAYRGFVHADWTWDMIQMHFIHEMQARHLLIWSTGVEHFWTIDVSLQPSKTKAFREITGTIEASKGRLLPTNFESLSMAAGFPEVSLPQAHEEKNLLSLAPGLYDCRIAQRSAPTSPAIFKEPVNFLYEISRADLSREAWPQIPWQTR